MKASATAVALLERVTGKANKVLVAETLELIRAARTPA